MFSKCANPQCSRAFEYHLGGEFFRFHQHSGEPQAERNTHEVVHFWLCGSCAEKYTLVYNGKQCEVKEIIAPVMRWNHEGAVWHGRPVAETIISNEPKMKLIPQERRHEGEKE